MTVSRWSTAGGRQETDGGVQMPGTIRRLSFDEVMDGLLQKPEPYRMNYLAMYSSWYGGVITDPNLMMVPIDDHLVHRGDGIFEAVKCVHGNIYALERHLDRLERSAQAIDLSLPLTRSELVDVLRATIRIAGVDECLIRVFVSRGPGGFSTNPYECPVSQLYIVITRLALPTRDKYEQGVTLKSSHIPIKKAYFANIKSCNYLPNVLMKKEAEDYGVNYTVSIDEQGFMGEGSTENVGIITRRREFLVPSFARILRGITVTRMTELAQRMVADGRLAAVGEAQLTVGQAYEAAEVMMFGTTFDVLPVVDYDGNVIGDGRPGPVFRQFLELMREDMKNSVTMLTPVYD
jgi:branched-subunit amino acid aminotransferase/4-amino-4-deoxychorismate lyase